MPQAWLEALTREGLGLFAARLIGLGFAAAVLTESLARLGLASSRWLRLRPPGPLGRLGAGFLLGYATLGTLFLGLGLAGLFVPVVLCSVPLAALAGSPGGLRLRPVLLEAAGTAGRIPRAGLVVLAAALVPAVPFLLGPEFEVDADLYHLGCVWQMKLAGRALLDYVPYAYHVPQLADYPFALPVVLGDDRIAKWMCAVCFAAAASLAAGFALAGGRAPAAWLGPVVVFSSTMVHWMFRTAKNDMPAAALVVMGWLLWREGRRTAAAVCLGFGVAGKFVYGPLAVVWLLAFPPPLRRLARLAAAFALPLLPWAVKAWLATGNPVYPFGWKWMPTLSWEAGNDAAWLDHARRLWLQETERPAGVWPAWLGLMRREHFLVLLALPGLLLLSRHRRAALVLTAGTFVVLAAGHFSRFLMPAVWMLGLFLAEEAVALPTLTRRAAVGLLAAGALARTWSSEVMRQDWWRDAFAPRARTMTARLTTRLEVISVLGALPARPGGRPPKVLSVGELRTYRFPCRIVYGGVLGETPLVWDAVRASFGPADVRRKFRQLGVSALLLNLVNAEWLANRYRDFPWDERMIRVYTAWAGRHLVVHAAPRTSDYFNGGFYVYRLLSRPLRTPQPHLTFLPGTESLLASVILNEELKRADMLLAETRRLVRLMPEVGHVWNYMGHGYSLLGDAANAFPWLDRFGRLGMVDVMNLPEWGANAARTGRLELASRILADAYRRYPDHRDMIRMNLAFMWSEMAVRQVRAGRLDRAHRLLELAEFTMTQVPGTGVASGGQSWLRDDYQAIVLATRGQWLLARGRLREGGERFWQACETAPQSRGVPFWRPLAERYAPRTPSFAAGP